MKADVGPRFVEFTGNNRKRLVFWFHKLKCGARARDLKFEISFLQMMVLMALPCHFCGTVPQAYRHKVAKLDGLNLNGIARVKNESGYTKRNCVPVCSTCNQMKLDRSKSEFLSHVKKICEFMEWR